MRDNTAAPPVDVRNGGRTGGGTRLGRQAAPHGQRPPAKGAELQAVARWMFYCLRMPHHGRQLKTGTRLCRSGLQHASICALLAALHCCFGCNILGCPCAAAAKAEPIPKRTVLSHADMVAAATVDNGPLSIGGWVPPTNFAAPEPMGARSGAGKKTDGSGGSISSGDGSERQPRSQQPNEAQRTQEDAADDVPGGGGGLVGYDSSSESDDSGSDAPAQTDRPVSFF